jgi:hypothetical protein
MGLHGLLQGELYLFKYVIVKPKTVSVAHFFNRNILRYLRKTLIDLFHIQHEYLCS